MRSNIRVLFAVNGLDDTLPKKLVALLDLIHITARRFIIFVMVGEDFLPFAPDKLEFSPWSWAGSDVKDKA
jgi:hypothetical protein